MQCLRQELKNEMPKEMSLPRPSLSALPLSAKSLTVLKNWLKTVTLAISMIYLISGAISWL
ncbi:MAG TPA: hypothetical protein VN611_01135 [Patescibacteria group bacterium]|nr:hypothetical protein [Patescibacteria group bacterium]